jgi:hypothetical protein
MSQAATDHNSRFRLSQHRQGRRRASQPVVSRSVGFLLLSLLAPGPSLAAQDPPPSPTPQAEVLSEGPVTADSADRIRAALERPPAKPPADAVDVIEFPFKVILYPLALVGHGISALMDVSIQPPTGGGLAALYREVTDWGITPALGGLGERSGLGGALRLDRFNPFFVEAGWTFRGWQLYRGGFVGNWGNTNVELAAGWYRQNSLLFWGLGSESPDGAESDYRWDNGFVTLTGRARFGRHFLLSVGSGFDRNNVGFRAGPFTDMPAFGVGVTRFARSSADLVVDLTHVDGFQQRGARFGLGAAGYIGYAGTSTEFWRGSARAEGYLSLNDRQQLALRGLVDIMRGNEAGDIPFMYLSSIGGTDILRSYNTNRFRDRDRLALTGEWRYEIWRDLHERSRVEAFVFWDEATVARKLDQIEEFRTSAGLGMRFVFGVRVRAVTFLAFGAEGARFTFSFATVEF